MWTFRLALCAMLVVSCTTAFVLHPQSSPSSFAKQSSMTSTTSIASSLKNNNFKLDNLNLEKMQKAIDLEKLGKSTRSMRENLFDGEFGTRGEGYVAAQFVLIACILVGGVPIVGDLFLVVAGPGFLLLGLGLLLLSTTELGDALSPWPVVSKSSPGLKTDGLYSQVRHPLYAGLLTTCFGFSMLTGSSLRLILTGLLGYVLYIKSEYEEDELEKMFPEYLDYKQETPGKFVPKEILKLLPWNGK